MPLRFQLYAKRNTPLPCPRLREVLTMPHQDLVLLPKKKHLTFPTGMAMGIFIVTMIAILLSGRRVTFQSTMRSKFFI